MDEIRRRAKVSSAKSTYTRFSGVSEREFSEKDFKGGNSALKRLKNSLRELSSTVEKGPLEYQDRAGTMTSTN